MKIYLLILIVLTNLTSVLSQNSTSYKKAEKLYQEHKYEEAISLYEKSLNEKPKNSYIYGQIAFAHLFLRHYEESKTNFTEAIQIDSTISDYYNGRGLTKAYIGDVYGAIDDFTKSIKLDPKFPHAYLNRGSAYTSLEKLDSAIADLNEALELDKTNPDINFQLARLLYKNKELTESIKQYNNAEKKGLKSDDLYLSRASVYYKTKDYENAIKDYSTIIKGNPKHTDALNNRAVLYDEMGKKDLAEKDRATLYKITGVAFKDPKDYVYERVNSKNGYYSIEVPNHWDVKLDSKDNEESMVITVPQKDANARFQTVVITLSYNYDMGVNYGVSNEDELVTFWQQSQLKNTGDYKSYDLVSQKQFMLNGWKALSFLTQSQRNENTFKLIMYELVTSKKDQLFYGYFQSAEEDFKYYQPIFDMMMKTIVIKGK